MSEKKVLQPTLNKRLDTEQAVKPQSAAYEVKYETTTHTTLKMTKEQIQS